MGARLVLVIALRLDHRTPTEQAQSAAGLLMARDMLQRLWDQIPEGCWDLLNNPAVIPACFHQLIDPRRR